VFAPTIDRKRRDLVAQAAEALARFGLIVPADAPSLPEFLRHVITAAATYGALCKRAAAPRKKQEKQRQQGEDHLENATYLSTSLFDPEDWLPAETE
jgi:hypothetical protein